MKKELKVSPSTAVSTPLELPADNIPGKVLIMPRVALLQPTSPAVTSDKYKAGQFINSVTEEKLSSNRIIPVYPFMTYIKWRPFEQGGGLDYKTNDPKDPRVVADTQWRNNEKPLCTEYLSFLSLVEGELDMPIVVSFCRTSFLAGRKLYTMSRMTMRPIWEGKYELLSNKKTNENKQTWYTFDVAKVGPSTAEEREAAKNIATNFVPLLHSMDVDFEKEKHEMATPTSDEY